MAEKARRKKTTPKRKPKDEKIDYSLVLDAAEKIDFEAAAGVEGIDDEIALMRVKIKSLLEKEPENLKHIVLATNTLAGLVKTRYKITGEQKKGLKEAIGNVLRDVALPLGISIGTSAISKRLG